MHRFGSAPLRQVVRARRMYATFTKPERIVLFGPPGAGKGTQSEKISRDYGVETFSTGDYLRQAVREGTSLGKQVEALMKSGRMIDDQTMSSVVKEMLRGKESFLLDGYPRNCAQAKELERVCGGITAAIFLDVPKSVLVERITNRRVHPGSGRVYHLSYNPPKVEGKDDETGEPLLQRDDDKEETLIARLNAYETMTTPLIEHYRQAGVLHVIPSPTSHEGYVFIKQLLDSRAAKE